VLYIADAVHNVIFTVHPSTLVLTLFAGTPDVPSVTNDLGDGMSACVYLCAQALSQSPFVQPS
jgi:hypothetical protein